MSVKTIPAGHHILDSQVRRYSDGRVQRAQEPSAGIGRTGRPRRRQPVDQLHCWLDGLESPSDGSVTCGSGIVDHRAPLLSGARRASDQWDLSLLFSCGGYMTVATTEGVR
jgi:hypothetical protein